jgi:hypothetical protein
MIQDQHVRRVRYHFLPTKRVSPVRGILRRMKPVNMVKAALTATGLFVLTGTACALANAQDVPKVAVYNGRTFVAARITLGADFPPVKNNVFTWTPVLTLKKDAALPARGVVEAAGENQMWSVSDHDFAFGARTVKYPAFGLVNFASTGDYTVVASTTVSAVGLKAGQVLHSDGYLIEANCAVEVGEAIPTLRVVGKAEEYIMSIEAAPQEKTKPTVKLEPCLTIISEHGKLSDRTNAVEAWRLTNKSVGKGFPPIIPTGLR